MTDGPPRSDPDPFIVETALGPVACTVEGPEGAPPILCLHGLPGSVRDFRYLAPHLVPAWRVVRLDLPGFGGTPAGPHGTLASWAAVAVAAARALDLRRPAVLGHSFGGGAALLAAADPALAASGLVLVASLGLRRHRALAAPPAAFRALARALALPGLGPAALRWARARYAALGLPPPADAAELRLHLGLIGSVRFGRLRRAAAALECPAVVVHARDDRLVQPAIARELAAAMPGARLELLEQGGHHLQRTRPGAVAAAAAGLLGR